jgi:Putative lumazine-binding
MKMDANAEIAALTAATQVYFDGLYEGDTDKLATVFLPTSALTQVADGKLTVTPRDTWLDAVRTRANPKASGLAREDHILTIDLISPTLAHVKVKCQIPPRYFTDILSFVKLEGEWRVAQKVFTTETRA